MQPTTLGADWDAFVEASAEGTLFSLTAMAGAVGLSAKPYFCLLGSRVVAGILTFGDESEIFEWSDFLVYGGIMYSPADRKQNSAQVSSDQFKVGEFIVDWLAATYSTFHFPGSPSFADWRPFLWHNHGSTDGLVDLELRYTSVLDFQSVDTSWSPTDLVNNPLASGLAKSRRQTIRYGLSDGIQVSISQDIEVLMGMLGQTFSRQGVDFGEDRESVFRRISASLLSAGLAELWVASDSAGRLLASALVGKDSKRAYYIFGGNLGDDRSDSGGSVLVWDLLHTLAKRGVREFDLEGVNSPSRGYFKSSFGGRLVPYHRVSFPARRSG